MTKRILAAVMALVVTLVGVIVFCLVFRTLRIPGEDYTRLVLAAALLGSSIYILRRSRRWPAVLLVVGSVAVMLLEIHEAIVFYMLNHGLIVQPSWFWPTCTENPQILNALSYLLCPALCLPAAWFWYSFQATHRHLTNRSSQPLTGA
jgi:hypothetical protein